MSAVAAEIPSRDMRRVNHMDPETKIVHSKLEAWGAWAKDAELRAWPASTILARMIDQQATGAAQSGRPPIAMPDEIAAVDAAVCKLGVIDKRAVQLYYIRWQSIEVLAGMMRMRPRQFQNVLRRARWRLAAYMNYL
jgi:DNA-directed RNA polymerase specialized sigma24 family protein